MPTLCRPPNGLATATTDNAVNLAVPEGAMCEHQPRCPDATALDHPAARVAVHHPEQGWSLLCNGVVTFDDLGELLPDGRAVPPHPVRTMAMPR